MTELTTRQLAVEDTTAANTLLSRLGFGDLLPESVSSVTGRNTNWIGETQSGISVFVKQLHGRDRTDRLTRISVIAGLHVEGLRMPEMIGLDFEDSIVAFRLLPEAKNLLDRVAADEISLEDCASCATLVAALHNADASDLDKGSHPLPPMDHFDAIPFDAYSIASGAQLDMWRLFQNDSVLQTSLNALRRCEEVACREARPTHGDLRLDQFTLSRNYMYLMDFEEARLGDPARDVGSFIGEWLHQAVIKIPEELPRAFDFGHQATHQEVVETGLNELEKRTPYIREFFETYCAERSRPEGTDFSTRCAAYAGWHMLDRMLAASADAAVLSAGSRAAGGIGRTLLVNPEEFTSTLGMG
ncbi:class V lanthionine synthetase subunit LxmK [Nocardia amamiensis]|uniref:class V lanthionine synthetase subunit LxmK n=1 Tax=Nocardia TaxID=1817 RepID=UPI0033E4A271